MTLFQAKAKLMDDMRLRNFTQGTIDVYYRHCHNFLEFTKVKDTSRLTEKELSGNGKVFLPSHGKNFLTLTV